MTTSNDSRLPDAHDVAAIVDEDAEARWLREVYQPNEPNLTMRAVIVGILIGFVMSLSNIYVFFKTGWSLGVTLTACILAFAVFKAGEVLRIVRTPLGPLENNALTTVASGAGYMTAGGNAAAFGALVLLTTATPNKIGLVAWFAIIAALGVFAAIPIKRQLINKEALPFPTGTATAETIRTIHGGSGSKEGSRAAIWLGVSALFAGVLTLVRDLLKWIPGSWAPPVDIFGHALAKWSIAIKTEAVLIGAGALMSFRTGWSLFLGSCVTFFVIAPQLLEHGLIGQGGTVSSTAIINWTLWPGAAILVGAGLTAFALDYKSIARAFSGLGSMFSAEKRAMASRGGIADVEAPEWWFPAGLALLTPAIVALMWLMFDIPVWAALLAVPIAILMGFVASRVTGETDVTPTKALGPVTQAIYGVLTPGNLTGNIMSANVTGGIGLHAADLLTTLKTGWLLGAKPRHQFYAQLFGVVAGAAIIVPLFYTIVPFDQLGGDEWPAPSVKVWAGVSQAFAGGIGNLPTSARIAIGIGLALGIGMTLVEKAASKRIKPYLPSPAGLGLAMIMPFSNGLAMFIGAVVAEGVRRYTKAESYIVPIASGVIAGESIVGIIITIATL